MYTILVASLNENAKLATILQEQLNSIGVKNEIINLIELGLPMYSSKEEERGIPNDVQELVKILDASEGYVIVSPEYNYSMPPVLTNTIAWISRVDEDFRRYFNHKKILLATHSGGGGTDVLRDMRNQLSKLGAKVFEQEILTTYQNSLDKNFSKEVVEAFVKV
jgi:NAD(P)H-dependent FMN reductase